MPTPSGVQAHDAGRPADEEGVADLFGGRQDAFTEALVDRRCGLIQNLLLVGCAHLFPAFASSGASKGSEP